LFNALFLVQIYTYFLKLQQYYLIFLPKYLILYLIYINYIKKRDLFCSTLKKFVTLHL